MNYNRHTQIMGTELEWNVGVRLTGEKTFRSFDSAQSSGYITAPDLVDKYLLPGMEHVGQYMSNGSRYYIDYGTHPEYATPENTSPKGLLVSELAGERIVADGLHRMLQHNERMEEVVLMKRVVDVNGEGTGYHLNMSEDRRSYLDVRRIHPLAWHLAVAQPILGAGMVERYPNPQSTSEEDKYKYRYSWGQKVMQVTCDFSSATTRARPFINTRDEPHSNEARYWRHHIIGVDPHILEWPAWMLFGTTSLMLAAARQKKHRQMEMGIARDSPATYIAHYAKYDLEDKRKYAVLVDGKEMLLTANEINKMHIEDVEKVSGKTDEQKMVLEEWKRAAADRDVDVMRLQRRSDAVTKLAGIRKKQVKAGRDKDDFTEGDLDSDQRYTTVFRATKDQAEKMSAQQIYDSSPAATVRKQLKSPAIVTTDEEVERALLMPPTSTRANLRGYLIRKHKALGLETNDVNWRKLTVKDKDAEGNEQTFQLHLEPLDGTGTSQY